jgi:hypothetical protein
MDRPQMKSILQTGWYRAPKMSPTYELEALSSVEINKTRQRLHQISLRQHDDLIGSAHEGWNTKPQFDEADEFAAS